jgi:1-deoxy-D-xylulose-5-phosphate reductoisomerase
MPKTVTILGATGTIGQNTMKVIRKHQADFEITALTAGENFLLLAANAKEFRPKLAVISNPAHYSELKNLLHGTGVEVAAGEDAVIMAASMGADITMSAIVGAAGLKPTLAAIKTGKTIALANKECLACAGAIMQQEIAKYGAKLIPVDSEHSGIFQLLSPNPKIERITITASGGPFRKFSLLQMKNVTPKQATAHPNWNMGAKISVDSATMMNKGLELIEAFYLFPLRADQLHILVHPESIVHALVEMVDGSVLAQLSSPDMCVPIAYALAHPARISAPVAKLRLEEIGSLTFEKPDEIRFPALAISRFALMAGGSAPTILNAANEIAVQNFLQEKIGFLDIAKIVEQTLEKMENIKIDNIEDVLTCDASARAVASEIIYAKNI